jgi:hypothetical protein
MIRIKIGRNGNLGNKMFQYMYCRRLQDLIPTSVLEHLQIPEYHLTSPDFPLEGRTLTISGGHRYSMHSIAYLLNKGIYDNLYFDGYVMRLEYYPDREFCSGLFRSTEPVDRSHLGPDSILLNVRAGDVLTSSHHDYGPVPVDFFSQIADASKLTPVIMGQLGADDYSDEIRRRFSKCTFLPSVSPLGDFELIRNATNIAIGVSSFSWLASWLSDTAQQIHLPVSGFFHPKQRPDVDLLPIGDRRYHLYEFPVRHWQPTDARRAELLLTGQTFPGLTASRAKSFMV